LGVHPQAAAVLAGEAPAPADLAAHRAAYRAVTEQLGGPPEPVVAVEAVQAGGRPAALYDPGGAQGLLVWLHGGGWILGDLPAFDRVARALANAAGHKVLLVDYRLAPEHRWPAQVHDAGAALRWARSAEGAAWLGVDPARVAIGGDSAGGQLAAVAARHARDDGLPPVVAQLLVYPALDPRLESPSQSAFGADVGLTRDDLARCWAAYLGTADPDDPDVAPLRAPDLAGLPPAWIAVAGQDPLRDDGLRYAAALREAGVPAAETIFDDMVHGCLRWAGAVDRVRELIAWLGAALQDARPGPRPSRRPR
jgi:acetyl esterase